LTPSVTSPSEFNRFAPIGELIEEEKALSNVEIEEHPEESKVKENYDSDDQMDRDLVSAFELPHRATSLHANPRANDYLEDVDEEDDDTVA